MCYCIIKNKEIFPPFSGMKAACELGGPDVCGKNKIQN